MDDLKHSRVTEWIPAIVEIVGPDILLVVDDGDDREFVIKLLRPELGLSGGVMLAVLYDGSLAIKGGNDG